MGTDAGPAGVLKGALEAGREGGVSLLAVGDRDQLEHAASREDTSGVTLEIVHAPEVIGMNEGPTAAIRKKRDSSLVQSIMLVREGRAEAVVSGGNTGATMAAATLLLGRLAGVERPAIAVPLPRRDGDTVVLDAGANAECKATHLKQFGIMGSVYAARLLERAEPSVGLLSIGKEEGKGNELTKEAFGLLSDSGVRFVGNVEGRNIFDGTVDVVVCDGFVGNVILKTCEGVAEMLARFIKEELMRTAVSRLGGALARGAFKRLRKRIDYAERGGAPLLGVAGVAIISHGSSSPRAYANAVRVARRFVVCDVNGEIEARLAGSAKTSAEAQV